MVTKPRYDEIRLPLDERLEGTRSYLEYARRSSPKGAAFTVTADVETLYGKGGLIKSERGLVEYALAFANVATDRSIIRSLLKSGKAAHEPVDSGTPFTAGKQLEHDQAAINGVRARYREFLAGLLPRRVGKKVAMKVLPAEHRLALVAHLRRVWRLPEVELTAGGVKLKDHSIIFDLAAFDAFIALLLLDEDRPYRRDLCQCQLTGCGQFFLVKKPKTGRPRREYCSTPHMDQAHMHGAADRVKKFRTRKAAKRNPQ